MVKKDHLKWQTPLRWYGNKSRQLKLLDKWLPNSLTEYREPFLGSGSVFLLMRQKVVDSSVPFWINDADNSVYSFWKSVQDDPEELIARVEAIREGGRANPKTAAKSFLQQFDNMQSSDTLTVGVGFLIVNLWAFNNIMARDHFHSSYVDRPHKQLYPRIRKAHELLDGVRITNVDYKKLFTAPPIAKSDAGLLLFLDPPYDDSDYIYEESMDHDEFTRQLIECPHHWAVTHSLSDRYKRRSLLTRVSAKRQTWIFEHYKDGAGSAKRDDVIIANFDPQSDLWQLFGYKMVDGVIQKPINERSLAAKHFQPENQPMTDKKHNMRLLEDKLADAKREVKAAFKKKEKAGDSVELSKQSLYGALQHVRELGDMLKDDPELQKAFLEDQEYQDGEGNKRKVGFGKPIQKNPYVGLVKLAFSGMGKASLSQYAKVLKLSERDEPKASRFSEWLNGEHSTNKVKEGGIKGALKRANLELVTKAEKKAKLKTLKEKFENGIQSLRNRGATIETDVITAFKGPARVLVYYDDDEGMLYLDEDSAETDRAKLSGLVSRAV